VSAVEQDEYGRPEPPLVGNEVETLLGFLDYQRATLAWKCAGLDDDPVATGAISDLTELGWDAQAPSPRRGQMVQ